MYIYIYIYTYIIGTGKATFFNSHARSAFVRQTRWMCKMAVFSSLSWKRRRPKNARDIFWIFVAERCMMPASGKRRVQQNEVKFAVRLPVNLSACLTVCPATVYAYVCLFLCMCAHVA